MKAEKFLITGLLLFLPFLLAVCAPEKAANIAVKEAISEPSIRSTLEPWQIKWDNLVKEARKEGVLVIYSSGGPEIREGFLKPLWEKFGIRLEYISGRGADISQRILSEHRNGINMADLYIGGATTMITQLKPAGDLNLIEPELFLPEALDLKAWGGELLWVDKQKYILAFLDFVVRPLTVNTSLVKTEEIKAYRDLLNPKYKKKLIMDDPTIAGIGRNFFVIVGGMVMGYDYLRELVKQEPVISRDQYLQVQWLAQGKYSVAITTKPAVVTDFQRAGAPLDYPMPEEGMWTSSGTGNLGMLVKPSHPYAARLFANWLLTREGQALFVKAYGAPSGRSDVPAEGVDPTTLRRPGLKYLRGYTEEIELKSSEDRKIALEIFAPLMK